MPSRLFESSNIHTSIPIVRIATFTVFSEPKLPSLHHKIEVTVLHEAIMLPS